MSKIITAGLDQYGVEPFEQQQFGRAGVEGVSSVCGTSPAYFQQVCLEQLALKGLMKQECISYA